MAMAVLEDERGSFGSAGAISLNQQLDEMASGDGPAGPVERDALSDLMVRGRVLGRLLERSAADPTKAPMAKLLRSELDFALTAHELMATGPSSLFEGDVADRFLYAPGMRIAGGSSEIQRNIIGERVLGLPREPRVS